MLAVIKAFLTVGRQRVVVISVLSSWSPVTSGESRALYWIYYCLYYLSATYHPGQIIYVNSLLMTQINIHAAHARPVYKMTCSWGLLVNYKVDMQMRLHPAKCRTMQLGKHNPNTKYTLPNSRRERLRSRYEQQADLSRHIQLQVNKAHSAVGLIRHTFNYLHKESFLYLYKSLIRPHFEYA